MVKAKGQRSLLDFLGGTSGGDNKTSRLSDSNKRAAKPQIGPENSLVDELEISDDDETPREVARSAKIIATPPRKRPRFISKSPKSGHEAVEEPQSSWITRYAPVSVAGVAMHARKIEEIRKCLTEMMEGRSLTKILLLTGPAGSGKTAAVRAIANELEILTSIPSSNDFEDNPSSSYIEWHNIDSGTGVSLPESFPDFLSGVSFRIKARRSLVVVEDLPNLSHFETRRLFIKALMEWIHNAKRDLPPLVIIFTEIPITSVKELGSNYTFSQDESLIAERVFPASFLNDYRVKRIKVLPVNATLISKALKNVVSQESRLFTRVSRPVIDNMVTSLKDLGDIRCAISSLEFWIRWKGTSSKLSAPIARETTLSLFHAVGKIIYGSKSKSTKSKPIAADVFEEDEAAVSNVLADWGDTNQNDSFNLALLENYCSARSSQLDIDSIDECANILSDSSLMNSIKVDMSSEFSCRGLRSAIRHSSLDPGSKPVFRQLMFPREHKTLRKKLDSEAEYGQYIRHVSLTSGTMLEKSNAVLYDGYYRGQILKSQKGFRQRVGGDIGKAPLAASTEEEEGLSEENMPQITNPPVEENSPKGLTFSDDDIESD